jgi:oligopeptidase A
MSQALFDKTRLPDFSQIHPSEIEPRITQLLINHKKKLADLLDQTEYTWRNLMQPLEKMQDELSRTWSPIAHMRSVCESDELRQAYNAILPKLTEYQTEVAQNEILFKAISFIAQGPEFATLDLAQRKIIQNALRDFKLAGVHLSKDKKNRLTELEKNLSLLSTKFSENVLDATQGFYYHVTDEEKLKGLPDQAKQLAVENAKQRNLTGYVFTLDYPSYSTAIRFLENRELRKILYEAYVTRASDQGPNQGQWDNSSVMESILETRLEIAQLVGFSNYAQYSLATKMAKTTETVTDFLKDLFSRSAPFAQKEYDEVVCFAKQLDHITSFEAWDFPYYSEKLQETQFHFTQEDLRPYFPISEVLKGLFELIGKLYGVTLREETTSVWHSDVKFFLLFDSDNNSRGGIYVDLYARPHKRDGAWMDECLVRHHYDNQPIQQPAAYLTCNFMPPVDGAPALLTHDDVLTLFHEFGHCLHHVLTKVDYPSVAGINGVLWDAVEFPSQFMESFTWEKELRHLIAKHYQTQAVMPDELYEKMVAAKHFQTGLQMIRQLEFALFDFYLHMSEDKQNAAQIAKCLIDIRAQTGLPSLPSFNRFQHSFSHIFAGGYAAGYYSYKWAEVLSADAYDKFKENGLFNPDIGRLFLHSILEVGGVVDPLDAFVAFRGRKPSVDALLKQSGIVGVRT